jgi:hypothetical protein
VHGVAVVVTCFGLLALLLAWSRWLARRRLAAAGHLAMAIAAAAGALLIWSVMAGLESYESEPKKQPIAGLYVEKTGPQRFRAILTRLPAGRIQVFELTGDQWRLEARTLDWQGPAAQLGLDRMYRLERLSTRSNRPLSSPETAGARFSLGTDAPNDLWAKGRTSPAWMRHVRGDHANGPWKPLADAALFTIWLDGQALRVDAANEAAVTALKPAAEAGAEGPGLR